MKMKDIAKLKISMKVEEMVASCIKLFGSARAEEVLKQIYKGKELKKALALLDKVVIDDDTSTEVLDLNEVVEMEQIDLNEKEETLMTKKNTKAVKDIDNALDMHVDYDGIDAVQDTRVVNTDHGIDHTEDSLEWWLLHAKNSEMEPVPFRDVVNKFDDGVYAGTVRNVYAYFKFGQRRFVINVNLEPIYSKAEHRGYVFESCPVFLNFAQYKSICEELGWDFDNMEKVKGNNVNIVISGYDEQRDTKTYFIQGKKK